jgi:hypothetical protein
MKGLAQLGLIALLPAALNPAPAGAATMTMQICGGDGQVRSVEVPLDGPGNEPAPCCAKGCHGGSSRKKSAKVFEPEQ